MKRRVVSIITALALCLSLCPSRGMAAGREPDPGLCPHHPVHTEDCGYVPAEDGAPCTFVCRVCPVEALIGDLPSSVTPDNQGQVEDQLGEILALYTGLTADEQALLDLSLCLELQAQLDEASIPAAADSGEMPKFSLTGNETREQVFDVTVLMRFDACGYSFTAQKSTAIRVLGTGELHLMGGLIKSKKGAGVEVQTGGSLYIEDPALTVEGSTYGLDIASDATVKLSGGTFTGTTAAIRTADNDLGALLKSGYGYFDANGAPISDATKAKTVVVKALPAIHWDTSGFSLPVKIELDYTGSPAPESKLPPVVATIPGSEDLTPFYQYKKQTDSVYTDGLPTAAGTYDIIACLPETPDSHAVSSDPITLVINRISPIAEIPAAVAPTYNRSSQELVTPGRLRDGAAADGAVIEFAESAGGPYSEKVPAGVDAGSGYRVWYRVQETENYSAVAETEIQGVEIRRKEIEPTVTLSSYSYVYDGGDKEPTVTVKDGEVELLVTEYDVNYSDNRNVGTAKVTVTDKDGGNYKVKTTSVPFEITKKIQDTLSITNKPNTVTYGDQFTLSTLGGSDNGVVTWKITSGDKIAEVDPSSGQVTVIGVGTATVQATKSGTNGGDTNYEDATAEWRFNTVKKPVVAVVTAEDGTYSPGNTSAVVKAEVKDGVETGDAITISGLTGTFDNANAGTNKTVTVDTSKAVISGTHYDRYIVTYSSLTVTANINKAAGSVNTAPEDKKSPYNGGPQELVTAGTANNTETPLEYALSESGPYSTDIPQKTDAGSYDVWYRVRETQNYTGTDAVKIPATITKKEVEAVVTVAPGSYVYDGNPKKPDVTVTEAGGGLIPASEYDVAYSNHINAGTATVTVTAKADGNYTFTNPNGEATANFTIGKVKAKLDSPPQVRDLTFNKQAQALLTGGSATGGTIVYSETGVDGSYTEAVPKKTDADSYPVYYKVEGDSSHEDTDPSLVYVTIKPMEITADVTLSPAGPYTYTGSPITLNVTVKNGNDTIDPKEYTPSYRNNVNTGTATVTINNASGGNYIVSGTADFTIEKAEPTFTAPGPVTGLQYNGAAQELITRGSAAGGKMVYSLDGVNYSESVPTGTAVDSYTVYYKVLGDDNHNDLTPTPNSVPVEIGKNIVTKPTITLSSDLFRYDGSQHKPTVTVRDDKGILIPENEYDVAVTGTNGNTSMVSADIYTVTVTAAAGSHYDIISNNTKTFEITEADQEILSITNTRGEVFYGDVIQLGTTGGTGSGTVTWSIAGNPSADDWITQGGLLTVKDVGGPITVTATRTSANYSTVSTTWEFYASPKPVTAVLTGVDRDYQENDTSATVKAEVAPGDLVGNDAITIDDLEGNFADANVGTNKRITITTSTPTVRGLNAGKYAVTYLSTATASIMPVPAAATAPTAVASLTYKAGEAQALVQAGTGSATGGTLVYSLDGSAFSPAIPTGTDAGDYTVYYMARGDGNHTDSAVGSVPVTIGKQKVEPSVQLTPSSATYNGNVQQPAVTLRDRYNQVIPEGEYKVTYDPATNWKDKGVHTVTIEDFPGGNYIVETVIEKFTITEAESNPLEIVSKPGLVYYGDSFTLSAVGGSGNGAVTWESGNQSIADIDPVSGLVTVKDVGTVTITAKKAASTNYEESTASYSFTALKKAITGTVTAEDKVFDGTDTATVHVVWENGGLVGSDRIVVSGTFADKNVGTNKAVSLSVTSGGDKYDVNIPASVTASIFRGKAEMASWPQESSGLTFNGSEQDLLLSGGSTVKGIGVVEYSLSENSGYSTAIPTAANAGNYTVWYRVPGTDNYEGIAATKIADLTIAQATPTFEPDPPTVTATSEQKLSDISLDGITAKFGAVTVDGSFNWTVGDIKPEDGKSYSVKFTPNSTNYESVTFDVSVTVEPPETGETTTPTPPSSTPAANAPSAARAPSQASPPMQTSVQDGTATTVVTAAGVEQLVQDAAANQSKNVVIKPEISDDVSRAEVLIPASAVSLLGSETDADLTVSTPVADVTIPNEALETLSGAGGTVSVAAEQTENTITLTLSADGQRVEDVPGGVTLTVPAEDAGPGTVAVLVLEDGTRETIRKSVAADGTVHVPVSGSATIEIVDNSKAFDDVPAESWAADAVAFASAHELFNGTSETAFSPDQPMSRAMLATVLYNLEGSPEQSLTGEFSDVGGDAWYAAGVSWAAENGIANGYGDGLFGPDDNVTREQFAVMLWKYAGCPAANGQDLNFTDADQVSGYAAEALRWAAANGILSGYGDGRLDPGGLATRAQAAQMLKNFMENV